LAVGPEGGWSPAEVSAAREAKLPMVSLGPRILRAETAALAAIANVMYELEIKR
jgi:16S rRNA (uracil1498-N3)-methyltransferase